MPFFSGGDGSPSNTKTPGLRPTSTPSGILVHPAIWPQRTLAENWGLCPFRGGGAGSASNTMWPGRGHLHAKFHLDPSKRLTTIHQRHRQTGQTITNGRPKTLKRTFAHHNNYSNLNCTSLKSEAINIVFPISSNKK